MQLTHETSLHMGLYAEWQGLELEISSDWDWRYDERLGEEDEAVVGYILTATRLADKTVVFSRTFEKDEDDDEDDSYLDELLAAVADLGVPADFDGWQQGPIWLIKRQNPHV